jgi:L-ascorbate metabolism protein UlaG (beta-lactamase superfamily)
MKDANQRLALIFAVVSVVLTHCAPAQKFQSSPSDSPAWNDNSLMILQKAGGDPHRPGDVKIEFYGNDAFKITSPRGLTVLTDPWRNDPTGRYPKWFLNLFPAIPVDVVLSTHAHFDHDAIERPRGLIVLERLVGQFQLADVAITGLAEKHKCESTPPSHVSAMEETCPPNNVIAFDNAIQIMETGGLRIAIWGDNRPQIDPSVESYLQNLDVLILPVPNVLTPAEADAIVRKYSPRAVIPAHYSVVGLTTGVSGLTSADKWLSAQERLHNVEIHRLDGAELTLSTAILKGSHGRIYYFGNHIKKR